MSRGGHLRPALALASLAVWAALAWLALEPAAAWGAGASRRATPASRAARVPPIRSAAAVAIDMSEGRMLYAKNERAPRPIASITKLMTTLVFLESGAPLDSEWTVTPEELAGAGKSVFRRGEVVGVEDLLYATLLQSDNAAARGLARASGLPPDEFAARMNRKARSLGLADSRFAEPTGLDSANVSTALDCAALVDAVARNPYLREVMETRERTFQTSRALRTVHSTNRLLFRSSEACPVGKTGYINEAGYCIATCYAQGKRKIAVVVLGARSSSSRFREANDLIRWALSPGARPPASETSQATAQ
jgi:D-alanyl-D-alanine endopeptidase (penicillin-binding protein 7)